MMMRSALFLSLLSMITLTANAETVITIQNKHKSLSYGQASTTTYTGRTKALSTLRGQGVNLDVLYDNPGKALYLIDHKRKIINKIDQNTLAQSRALVEKVKKLTQSQLNAYSPEQQKLARNMLASLDRMKRTLVLQKTGKQKNIGQWTCDVLKGRAQGPFQLDLENCVISWQQAGISPGQITVLKKMYEFLSQMNTGGTASIPQLRWDQNGFPIESISKVNGKPDFVIVIHKIESKNVNPNIFSLPNYPVQDFKMNYPAGWDS